jgi:hypothetical protein
MTSLPVELVIMMFGFLVGSAFIVVSVVKTVKYHGSGQKTWAPPAIPWFIAGMVLGVLTLAYGLFWALA